MEKSDTLEGNEREGGVMKANTLSDVKRANKKLLYETIKKQGRVTMTELGRLTQLSRPTISGLIRELEEETLIAKNGHGISQGGRTPGMYSINAKAAFVIGIDLEFPVVRMCISDLQCNLEYLSIRTYPSDSGKEEVLRLLFEQLDELIRDSNIDRGKLRGVGIGIPGTVDYKGKNSVSLARIPGWENVPIGQLLEEHLGIPAYIDRSANLLSWAERSLVLNEHETDMLYFVVRVGIGIAIWTNGRLVRGEWGNAGRIGHMTVDINGPKCSCGSRGCLGLYASETAMGTMYREKTGRKVRGGTELVALAGQGDRAAAEVLETVGRYLGMGVLNAVNMFDITECVMLSSFDLSRVMEFIQETLTQRNVGKMKGEIHLKEAHLKEEQYAMGGCLLALEHVSLEDMRGEA